MRRTRLPGAFGVTTIALLALSLVAMALLLPLPDPRSMRQDINASTEPRESRPGDVPPGAHTIAGLVIAGWSGAPIEDVRVTVVRQAGNGQWTTTTDSFGRWVVTGLPEGAYGLLMTKDGMRTHYEFSPPVVVSSARPSRTLDVRMLRGGTLRGQVTNPEGQPMAGATVAVVRVFEDARPPRWEGQQVVTDRAGGFTLSGLPDGTFALVARRQDGFSRCGSRAAETTFFPSTTDARQARRFVVAEGATFTGLRLIMRCVPGLAMAGRVVTADGDPAAADGSYSHAEELFNSTSGVSSPQPPGTFRYDGLAPGRYRLFARIRTLRGWEAGSASVTLSNRDVTDLTLRLGPTTWIRERVVAERGVFRVPAPLRLAVTPADERSGGGPFDDGLVGSDGSFEIESVETPGRLVAIQPTHGWEISSVKVNGVVQPGGVLEYRPGAVVANVEVVMGRRASVIAGTLTRAVSTGCVVVLRRDDSGRTRCVASMNVRDGEFRSQAMPAGSYRVAATCTNLRPPESLEEVWERATPIDLADDEVKTVKLEDRDSAHAPASW